MHFSEIANHAKINGASAPTKTVEAFADCCGVSSSVFLLEFGPRVPTNIIRCEQFDDKTVWHLASLYEIRRLCGISLWQWDKSSVSTYPLDTFIKSREVKNLLVLVLVLVIVPVSAGVR